jgi:allantoate deiminase
MKGLHQNVNVERVIERLEKLAQCSQTQKGATRLSFTKESVEANRLVSQWMHEAGMTVRRDALNNVIGRYEGNLPEAPVLLIGSHLDSVVEAGKYDGALGVVAGIEAVQIMNENGIRTKHPIEVIGFCDEEGTRFHTTLLGSRAIAGTLREKDLEAKDKDGVTLAKAMQESGLDPSKYGMAARDAKSILGYLELHIEQGPVLEELNQACGAVSGIAGQSRYEFRVEGRAGHAGTVPVGMRKDALVGASEMIQAIERIALQYDAIVATVGKLSVLPGASNVIPGVVEGTLDVRSIDDERRSAALREILEECYRIAQRRGLKCTFKPVMESPVVACSVEFVETIESVLEDYQMKPIRLASGAGHDAMAVADLTDIGMIFVRCREGLSHHPDEYASPEDIQLGTSVLLDVILKIAVERG